MSELPLISSAIQKISRAKALIRRDESIRALESLASGLEDYLSANLTKEERFKGEVLIQETISEFNFHSEIRGFIQKLSNSPKAIISYKPGNEKQLREVLLILQKGLENKHKQKEQAEIDKKTDYQNKLENRALDYLKNNQLPAAIAAFNSYAEEFDNQPEILCKIGSILMDSKLYFEAADFYEKAIEKSAKASEAYSGAATCYINLKKYENAEAIYEKAIKTFGKHTKTLTNLAKIYLEWNKKDLAVSTALEAYKLDPTNTEAKEIVDKLS